MKSYISLAAATLLAGSASAAPVEVRATNIDSVVLQFALTLEHLENVFYKGALKKFTAEDFANAKIPASFYENLHYIAHDEQTHVEELSSALTAAGYTPNAACEYTFPYTDAKSFVSLATVFEGLGTSAYLGGAPLITSKAYLTAAGSILVSEALHTSLLRSTSGLVPNANPNGTPLDPTSTYTLAANFIKSCPKSNMALPFTPYPNAAVISPKQPASSGQTLTLQSAAKKPIPSGSFITFVSGLSAVSVPGKIDSSCKKISAAIPTSAEGQTYVFITSNDVKGTFSTANITAGPAILEVLPQTPTIDFNQS